MSRPLAFLGVVLGGAVLGAGAMVLSIGLLGGWWPALVFVAVEAIYVPAMIKTGDWAARP